MRQDRFVVRPRPWVLALYALGCAAFAGIGLFMVFDDDARIIGLAGLVFFGIGGFAALPRLVRPALVLTPQGIELTSGGLIPWEDIQDVGIARMSRGTKALGIRLSRTDRYLASRVGSKTGWRRSLARLGAIPVGGYHVILSPVQLDRPLKRFPGFLWEYWQGVARARGAPPGGAGPATGRSGW
jgi:hypothetical protein